MNLIFIKALLTDTKLMSSSSQQRQNLQMKLGITNARTFGVRARILLVIISAHPTEMTTHIGKILVFNNSLHSHQ